MIYVTRSTLEQVLDRVGAAVEGGGTLYLVGETSLVWEGVRSWTDEVEIAVTSEKGLAATVEQALAEIAKDLGIKIIHENPGDVIPLPEGWRGNCRLVDHRAGMLEVAHFDPYSVSLRFLARGDEEDYKLIIAYVERGWISMDELDRRLTELLPRFSFETIAQDPAEFRRKYKGLQQMARAKGLL